MQQQSLFQQNIAEPLANRLRPESLEEYVGQQQLVAPGRVLRRLIDADQIPSMIFWARQALGKPPWPGSSPGTRGPNSSISAR